MTTKIRDIYEKVSSKLKLRHVSSEENRGTRALCPYAANKREIG